MYQNAIYIFISWYNKICWFPVKKCRCQKNPRGLSHDSYIFWITVIRYNCAKFHHCRIWVTDFWKEGAFWPPHSPNCEQPRKCPSWIGFETKKNAFYPILKVSTLKIFKFLSHLLSYLEKKAWLERKS